MAAIPLSDLGRAVIVVRPRKGGVYLKRESYPKGYTPPHLLPYINKFKAMVNECRSTMTGLKGNEKVKAFNMCIGSKLATK